MSGQTDVGNGEKQLTYKNLLSWQNILNSRQIATGIEETQVNQGEVLRGEESVVFTFPYQTNGNHATELSTVGHVILRTALKRYFRFP